MTISIPSRIERPVSSVCLAVNQTLKTDAFRFQRRTVTRHICIVLVYIGLHQNSGDTFLCGGLQYHLHTRTFHTFPFPPPKTLPGRLGRIPCPAPANHKLDARATSGERTSLAVLVRWLGLGVQPKASSRGIRPIASHAPLRSTHAPSRFCFYCGDRFFQGRVVDYLYHEVALGPS